MPDDARDDDRESGTDAVNAAGARFRDAQLRRRLLHEAVQLLMPAPESRGNGHAHAAGA